MKYTLLQMTQDILSNMSSDEVNSISDSAESLQVATLIKQKYFDILSRGNLPEHSQVFNLQPSLTSTQPTVMFIPDGVSKVEWIKYLDTNTDTSPTPEYKYVTILPVEQFLQMTGGFDLTESTVDSLSFNDSSNGLTTAFTFYFKNNIQPQFCCILSNYYVIFDSYDNTVDSTLQSTKSQVYGQVIPTFTMVDSFTPDLDASQFSLLLNEAKALAFYELKQQPHAKAEQELKRQWSSVQKNKSLINRPTYFNEFPDFGRPAGGFRSGSSQFKARGWDTV